MENHLIDKLLEDMTLEEKLAQMTQLSPLFFGVEDTVDLTGPFNEMNLSKDCIKDVGSTLNYFGAKNTKDLQDKYLKNNRHKIPLMFMADVIYGYKTIFPIPLAMGCSFNPENYYTCTKTAAKEASVSGIHLTFSPMSDLVRDPRWGRVMESTGEDPYLNCQMTAAAVKGFQGNDVKDKWQIASCVKHFAGYGASQGGRDYNWVDLSKNTFRQYYLPSYKAAIDAGVKMVMTSFNVIDGVPASANKELFRNILRDEWQFKGTTISDYAAINETIINGLVKDGKDACKECIEAGVDIEMMSSHYINYGKELVEKGILSEEIINECVRNILNLKNELGLFENPYKDADEDLEKEVILCQEHKDKARKVAKESIVLLKNENNVLPLNSDLKIGVVGPFANSDNTMGGWSLIGKKDSSSLAQTIKQKCVDVITKIDKPLGSMQEGIFDIEDNAPFNLDELKECDVIIAAVGENPSDTGEAASKTNLRLSHNQEQLIIQAKQLGKPVIMIVFSGRPLEIKPMLPYCDAVVQAWFLGTESSNAITDVLFGEYNPSGRLSMSFPQTVGQIPVHYNCYNTGRPAEGKTERYVSKYLDCPNEPLFPFGYGLSYGDTKLDNFYVKQECGTVIASIDVTNISKYEIKETLQLYIRDIYASVVRPIKELKGFKQVILQPNESATIVFTLTKEDLKFYNTNLEYVFESGEFDIMIGKNSAEVFTQRIEIQ